MSDLVEQIDALLTLNAKGAVSHPVPGLAVELLERAKIELAARRAANTPAGDGVPRSQWGAEAWEILFGELKGAVPDELTDEVLQKLAETLIDHVSPALPSQVVGVTVKPLEWVEARPDTMQGETKRWEAQTVLGWYVAYECYGKFWYETPTHKYFNARPAASMAEAKAAAQSDFNTRIQSCITSPAAEPVAWRWTEKDGDTGGVTDREDIAEYAKVKGCDVTALYTHPAPSASREVTE
jgi:hypothetical protein